MTSRGKGKPKFHVGQIVMICRGTSVPYPVKLVRLTRIGEAEEDGFRWFDTLGNVEYEKRMRVQTRRESGQPPARRKG
jgi:hypothetical protein